MRYRIDELDRAIADSSAEGFVKVLTVPGKDRILGVTIVGAQAGELLAEFVLAMKHGLGLTGFSARSMPIPRSPKPTSTPPASGSGPTPRRACCAGWSAITPGGGGDCHEFLDR